MCLSQLRLVEARRAQLELERKKQSVRHPQNELSDMLSAFFASASKAEDEARAKRRSGNSKGPAGLFSELAATIAADIMRETAAAAAARPAAAHGRGAAQGEQPPADKLQRRSRGTDSSNDDDDDD